MLRVTCSRGGRLTAAQTHHVRNFYRIQAKVGFTENTERPNVTNSLNSNNDLKKVKGFLSSIRDQPPIIFLLKQQMPICVLPTSMHITLLRDFCSFFTVLFATLRQKTTMVTSKWITVCTTQSLTNWKKPRSNLNHYVMPSCA